MTIAVTIFGALIGFCVGFVCGRWALPIALRSQETYVQKGGPLTPLLAERRLVRLTTFAHRVMVPVLFAIVGGFIAHRLVTGVTP